MRKLLLLFLLVCPILQAQQPLDNDAVIKLAKAGLSDDQIITTINGSPGNYDISTDGLIALKTAKVGDRVVAAIVMKASGQGAGSASRNGSAAGTPGSGGGFSPAGVSAATGPNGLPVGIDDVGVYYKDRRGAWVAMLPEIVNFQSTGASKLKNIASAGIMKGDLNGRIEGSRARLNAKLPVVFAVYLPENVEITEYVLLELHPAGNARTFLSAAGGLLHTQAGARRDEIDFQPEKLAPRLYQITLPAIEGKGEFGLLAPGTKTASNKDATGKIYTVSVAE
jgi:hypothetical protein